MHVLLRPLVELLWPTRCAACQTIGPAVVCERCCRLIDEVGTTRCIRCGRRRQTAFASPDCSECFDMRIGVTRARSMLIYNDTARHLLAEFKYQRNLGVGQLLAARLTEFAGSGWRSVFDDPEAELDTVVPVPLHPRRMRERGFNQAELLARSLARGYSLRCLPMVLQRTRATDPQFGLSANQRLQNVRGAFAVNERLRSAISGRRILLVDDLMTTGATLAACARALRKGGSGLVYGLTIFSTHHAYEQPSGNEPRQSG